MSRNSHLTHSCSQSLNKENENVPTRQGRAFKIKLSLCDGPFLPQDLMHTNQKSTQLHLLAAKEVLQSQVSMSNLMGSMEKEMNIGNMNMSALNPAKIKSKINANLYQSTASLVTQNKVASCIDNFTDKCSFLKVFTVINLERISMSG